MRYHRNLNHHHISPKVIIGCTLGCRHASRGTTENAGVENATRYGRGGTCGTEVTWKAASGYIGKALALSKLCQILLLLHHCVIIALY